MSLVKADIDNIRKAALIIKDGGLVAFPTETVYGLGANGLDHLACAKIFKAKKRPFFDPLILHVSTLEMFQMLARDIEDKVLSLIENFWPGPLTIVVKKSDIVPDIVTAGLPTVAIRMPSHPVALDLISEAAVPIAAPSANLFGYLSPTKAVHVESQLGDDVKMILDGGFCKVGVESTIIRIDGNKNYLLRPGGIPIEKIETFIGKISHITDNKEIPDAPGQLLSHYSPRAKVVIIDEGEYPDSIDENSALLAFRTYRADSNFSKVLILSQAGDLEEAAANLFDMLHELDDSAVSVIYAERVPEEGLGLAIMNRLKKASYQ